MAIVLISISKKVSPGGNQALKMHIKCKEKYTFYAVVDDPLDTAIKGCP